MHYSLMNNSQPRPILKRASVSAPTAPPVSPPDSYSRNGVHFPPHTTIASTHLAYSADAYDRSPISVMPNECALPARGCPGRTYLDGQNESAIMDDDDDNDAYQQSSPGRSWNAMKNEVHPRVRVLGFDPSYRFNSNSPSSDSSRSSRSDSPARSSPIRRDRAPSLIPDLSSDASDESDHGAFAPFLDGTFATMPMSYHSTEPASRKMLSQNSHPTQLAFLPHPHSNYHQQQVHNPSQVQTSAYGYGYPSHPSPAPNHAKPRKSPVRSRRTSATLKMQDGSDEGCLGGF